MPLARFLPGLSHTDPDARTIVYVLMIAMIGGCGGTSGPPDDLVGEKLRGAMPSFIEVRDVKIEKLGVGGSDVQLNCKAIVAPKEDLYTAEGEGALGWSDAGAMSLSELLPGKEVKSAARLRQDVPQEMLSYASPYAQEVQRLLTEYDKTPRYRKLTVAGKSGQEITLYAKTSAQKMVDKWVLRSFTFETPIEKLGKPRASFGPECLVPGSAEAARVAVELNDRLNALERQLYALVETYHNELTRKREDEEQTRRREKEREAERFRALLAATTPGKKYLGTFERHVKPSLWKSGSIVIQFTRQERDGAIIEADLYNLKMPSQVRRFVGSISRDPKSKFPILLKADPASGVEPKPGADLWILGKRYDGGLSFAVEGTGLVVEREGEGRYFAGLRPYEADDSRQKPP